MEQDILGTPEVCQSLLKEILEYARTIRDSSKIFDAVVSTVSETLNAERGFMMLKLPGSENLIVCGTHNIAPAYISTTADISQTVIHKVVEDEEAILSVDALKDPRFQDTTSVVISGLRSILCAPVKVRKNTYGMIYLDNRVQASSFKSQHLQVLIKFLEIASPFFEILYNRFQKDEIEKEERKKRRKTQRRSTI